VATADSGRRHAELLRELKPNITKKSKDLFFIYTYCNVVLSVFVYTL